MKDIQFHISIKEYDFQELTQEDRQLVNAAIEATRQSYAPYSRFAVGAAVRLKNGIVVTGSNQENAAYPSGTCAERTALFYANSRYPDQAVEALAIAAHPVSDDTRYEICPPCGACRQVMLETTNRFKQPFRLLLYGNKSVYVMEDATSLLPLSFGNENLK